MDFFASFKNEPVKKTVEKVVEKPQEKAKEKQVQKAAPLKVQPQIVKETPKAVPIVDDKPFEVDFLNDIIGT